MNNIGNYALPITISLILIFGYIRKVPLFDTFTKGAFEGMKSTASIAPSLIGLITSVSMLKASGTLDVLSASISPLTNIIGVPSQIIPLLLLRPVSGSGSIALLNNLFEQVGVDSFAGRIAAVMCAATETTFYAITVYFGSIGIKNTRHTIPAALTADIASFFLSVFIVRLLFGM